MSHNDLKQRLLEAALPNVAFDGWSEATLRAAIRDVDVDPALAKAAFPRGAVDMAIAYHQQGDAEMIRRIRADRMEGFRFRDKVTAAVRHRIEAIDDKEAVRRGATLFALPIYAADGAKAIWGTADAIWTALGDTSEDINWYTKRATLSGVYGATVLYWLGDDSAGAVRSWAFLDRRIEGVMQVEQMKASAQKNPLLRTLLAGPNWVAEKVRAPRQDLAPNMPGRWTLPRRG